MSAPTETEILNAVIDAISKTSLRRVAPDALLLEGRVLDSMGVVDLLVTLQERFPVELLLSEVTPERFGTPQLIAGLILEKLRKPA